MMTERGRVRLGRFFFFSALSAIVTLAAPAAKAQAGEPPVALLRGQPVKLYSDLPNGLIISESCHQKNLDCEAYRALKRASFKKVASQLEGGANPGAMICLALSGKPVELTQANQSSTSYCEFKDGSLVASGSLSYYGRKNDDQG